MANTLKFGNGEWYGKEGTILAYNDENYNYKPLPFNFSRDSKATVINKDGLIETVGSGQPRIDYKDDSKGALKLEPSRSNLVTYSGDFSEWSKSSSVIVTDNTTDLLSPSGEYNASKIEYGDSSKNLFQAPTMSGNYSGFFYVKGTEGETIRMSVGGNEQNFTLSGDWDIIKIENVTALVNTINVNTFGGATARTIYLYGAQLEQGSYATSYIPTQGSAVTRLADSCSQTVPSGIIGQTEGTLYTEINITKLLGATTRSIVRLGSAVDLVDFSFLGTLSNSIRAVIRTSANTRFQAVFEIQSVGVYKLAIGYKSNDSVFYVNGVQINNTINTSFTMPSIEDITYDYSNELSDSVNQTKLYNTRLSNSELQALTS